MNTDKHRSDLLDSLTACDRVRMGDELSRDKSAAGTAPKVTVGEKALFFTGPAFPANNALFARSVVPDVVMFGLAVTAAASLRGLFSDLWVKRVDHSYEYSGIFN